MALLVQKYGGTSVASVARMRDVCARAQKSLDDGDQVVVVVSAMGDETDRLADLCREAGGDGYAKERDVVLSSGEQACAGLTAIALAEAGVPAQSLTGAQAGIITDNTHGRARILDIDTTMLRAVLAEGKTPVVTGFQGKTAQGDITTLGRGGSDTTGVAVASALGARECQICTDVDGIYTADPRVCPNARKLDSVTFEEILEMASLGAKVLQIRAVEMAGKYRVPVRVLPAKDIHSSGTLIDYEDDDMEKPAVTGVAFDRAEAKITVAGVPDKPGIAHQLLAAVAGENINVDMILQNIGANDRTDLSFTVPRDSFAAAMRRIREEAAAIGADTVFGDDNIVKVSAVGIGMKSHAGVACAMFRALAAENINIQMISTSEIRISVVIHEDCLETAVRSLHDAFGLGAAAKNAL